MSHGFANFRMVFLLEDGVVLMVSVPVISRVFDGMCQVCLHFGGYHGMFEANSWPHSKA